MATAKEISLSRISLKPDRVLEIQFDRLPDPPPEMLKLPGVAYWWHQMKLTRERDINALTRLVNNISSLTNE